MTEFHSRRFDKAHMADALDAARGRYPIDCSVAWRGNCRRSSEPVACESSLRALFEVENFGRHFLDAVVLWLPQESARVTGEKTT